MPRWLQATHLLTSVIVGGGPAESPAAWWLWGAAHVYFLVSLRNRLIVVTQWLWSYAFLERGARLITGADRDARR